MSPRSATTSCRVGFRMPLTQRLRSTSDTSLTRSSRRSVNMQSTSKLLLAGALLLMSTKNAQSQDRDALFPPVAEFRQACTSRRHMGHFRRSGSLRYHCVLPNGDTATLLTGATQGTPGRVIGVIYETRAPSPSRRARAKNWLGLKELADGELIRWSRGSDGCVFAEWNGTHSATVLLRCPQRTTIARMLYLRGDE